MPAIEQARSEDFDELKKLLDAANDYSVRLGERHMWTAMDHAHNDLRAHLENGDCYVIRGPDGSITSAVGLNETSEDWGAREDGRGLHIGKLMKDPAKARPDEGLRLIGFAAAEALRRHKTFLRCDAVAEFPGLLDYYKRLGFEEKGNFLYRSSGRQGIFLEASPEVVLARIQKQN